MWWPYGIECQNYEHDPLTIDQVKIQFPGGFRIIRIDHGIAAITDVEAKRGWYADFRPAIGPVTLEPLCTLKRFHRKQFEQRFKSLRSNLSRHLYGIEVHSLTLINK